MNIPENTSYRWVVGLSNGDTLVEGKGIVSRVTGELSPWLKLQQYLEENKDVIITSLSMRAGDKHVNLPSNKPKFNGQIPSGFNCFRKVAFDVLVGGGGAEHYICIEAIYDGCTVQMWADENDTNKVWVNIV